MEAARWSKGQTERQAAFLCYSGGTSGISRGVITSHRNVIVRICFQNRNIFGIAQDAILFGPHTIGLESYGLAVELV